MDDLLSIAVSNAVAATVLALAAVVVAAVYRRPAVVHGLWLLVLLKLVTPPLLRIPIAWPATAEPAQMEAAVVHEEPPPAEEPTAILVAAPDDEEESSAIEPPLPLSQTAPPEPILWPQMLQMLWGVGSLAWFLLALERLHRFRRLLRFAQPAPATLQERGRHLAQSLALKHCPRIRLLPGRLAPMLWAVGGSPRLLVPADLLDVLSEEQLDTLLVHELAHLRRRDHWVRVLEFIVMGLYWWHPVVWYARRELREAEEQCCDAWVVSMLAGAGRTYASALLDTLDFLSTAQATVPPLASGLSHVADLKRRLTMIMGGTTPRSLSWPGCLAVITMGLTFLPMLPALHGQQAYTEEKISSDDEVKAAKAALEVQKALLEQQKAKIAHAEEQLKKAAAAMEKQRVILQMKLQHQGAIQNRQGAIQNRRDMLEDAEGERKPKIRIEILVNAEDIENLSGLDKKLKGMFPQKSVQIRIQKSGERTNERFQREAHPPGEVTAPPPLPPRPPQPRYSRPGGVGTPSSAPLMPPNSPPSRQDKRINDLEKKLEKVLRELQELRKQMQTENPRSGTWHKLPPRVVPAPAGGGAPPLDDPYFAPTLRLKPDKSK